MNENDFDLVDLYVIDESIELYILDSYESLLKKLESVIIYSPNPYLF